eukprot:11800719-Ditylum_brightwellii.AAC.2
MEGPIKSTQCLQYNLALTMMLRKTSEAAKSFLLLQVQLGSSGPTAANSIKVIPHKDGAELEI